MRYPENIIKVAALLPDYMGFIFYDKSPRNFEGTIPELPESIKKVGVFVNTSVEEVIDKVITHNLEAVQLHGEESPEYCKELNCQFERSRELISPSKTEIIKVFSIKDKFDFSILEPYESVCDYFLFDTKGKNPGGNGYTFNWSVLEKYPFKKPYFLSGGIGLDEIEKLESFLKSDASNYCEVIDVNSKFEIEAGLKNTEKLKKFKNKLK
ncbi:phosphoribosylanthranilate isomerase [Aureibaculum sp. 2210JD6-5]|uniref:phosphoribosylanthranilate isomerase n=1 Tax=Aureibaculum sp. 2210JD6-5 TaxID=3103957 RepID=UPI002AAD374F|nr:phosphoribosylanthranilate isomerase [Aureibaculum sp. 2210JD6-5]MDY7394811.1 phosphoribosylanthranilate isomerase [Aureibaculum sp. 2210JD6-5]